MPNGLSILPNCQTVSYPAVPTVRKKTTEVRCQFDSAVEALQAVIQEEDPDIIAFGETHPNEAKSTKPTTLMLFTEQLLPVLQQNKCFDLVVEGLISDLTKDHPATDYLASKLEMPQLEKYYFFPPKTAEAVGVNNDGLVKLLGKAKELPKNLPFHIYGGGPSLDDPEKIDIYKYSVVSPGGEPDSSLQKLISERTVDVTLALLDQVKPGKKRVAIYSGGEHNDLTGRAQKNGPSYGKFFRKKTPYKYVKFNILTPELMDKGHFRSPIYPVYKVWLKNAVPAKGVILIKQAEGSYTMILPAGTLAP
ncbi:MAG: hypothetical protein JW873_05930 [Candidatus Saganbacteria bacterium]|nr:hypothetical protein [Candidatus Saganbacteria bacterium]